MLIWLVRVYRFTLSPALTVLFGPVQGCRYTPTCSQYALEALARHGAFAGSVLTVRRVCRCHPWSKCDHNDPVMAEPPVNWPSAGAPGRLKSAASAAPIIKHTGSAPMMPLTGNPS